MSVQHNVTLGFFQGSTGFSKTLSKAVDAVALIDDSVAAGAVNKAYAVPLDVSALLTLGICSDKDVTLKTNSTSAPADTLTLKANEPIVWYAGGSLDNPLGTDVTVWYATNAGTEAANLQIIAGFEPTP